MSTPELIDIAVFGENLERSLHSALEYDARPLDDGRPFRRSSASLHALDAQLTQALKRGWVSLNHDRRAQPKLRFCLTFCGVAHFKAWVWVCPIGRLFDGGEPHRLVIDRLRLMSSLAPGSLGVVWLTPSPRITQFELSRTPQRIRELLREVGLTSRLRVVLPEQGVAGVFQQLIAPDDPPLEEINSSGARSSLVLELNQALTLQPRLSVFLGDHRHEPRSLDELVPILDGEFEGVDRQVWRVRRPFYICQTLMTRSLYDELMGVDSRPEPSTPIPELPYLKPPVKELDLREPVSRVSWLKATRACNLLSLRHGQPPYYRYEKPDGSLCAPDDPPSDQRFEGGGWAVYADLSAVESFRLPHSEEWCYAAAARQVHPYAGGEDPDLLAWSAHNSGSKLHPVASLDPNRWGLYDMNGLLWEWCEDGPSDQQVRSSERWGKRPQMRLLCDSATQAKWLLGGSWANHPWVFPIGERLSEFPTYADDFMGLRVVRDAQKREKASAQRLEEA